MCLFVLRPIPCVDLSIIINELCDENEQQSSLELFINLENYLIFSQRHYAYTYFDVLYSKYGNHKSCVSLVRKLINANSFRVIKL